MADETADRPLEDLHAREAALETGPANVPGGVMNMEPGTEPGSAATGSRLGDGEWTRRSGVMEFDRPEPPISESDPARARLRAFEDRHLGPDAVRIGGEIERGSGSHYRDRLSTEQRAQHLALEQLVKAEDDLAAASAELARAETAHEAAMARLAAMEEAAHGHE